MTVNLRLSLAIFSAGFAVEAGSGLYTILSRGVELPADGAFLALRLPLTFVGLVVLYLGRHEWSELHARRVRHAHGAFVLSLIALAGAAAPVAYYGYYNSGAPSGWAYAVFGLSVAATIFLTFITYVLVAFHLTDAGGKGLLVLGGAWAGVVSYWIGNALAHELPAIIAMVRSRTPRFGPITTPIVGYDSYLGVTYVFFLVAYLIAHERVARGAGFVPPGATPPGRPQRT